MNCKKIRLKISLYIDGRLSEEEQAAFKAHVAECKECKKALEDTRRAVKAASEIPAKPLPEGFYERLDRKLDEAVEGKIVKKSLFENPFLVQGIATAVVLIMVLVVVREMKRESVKIEQVVAPVPEKAVPEKKDAKVIKKEKEPRKPETIMREPVEEFSKAEIVEEKKEVDRELTKAVQEEAVVERLSMEEQARTDSPPVEYEMAEGGASFDSVSKRKRARKLALPSASMEREEAKVVQALMSAPEEELRAPENEWKGYNSGYTLKGQEVFKDKNSWQAFWQEHTSINIPPQALPEVDFNINMVIAVFMGQQGTGGYSVEIIEVAKLADRIVIRYKESIPQKGAMVTQALTQPYHIKVIEKSDLPVVFEKVK